MILLLLILWLVVGVVSFWAASVALYCRAEIKRLSDGGEVRELPWWVKPFAWRLP
jgi:hypothetical protein